MLKNGSGQEVVAEIRTTVSVLDKISGESELKENRRQLGSTQVQDESPEEVFQEGKSNPEEWGHRNEGNGGNPPVPALFLWAGHYV